MKKNSSKKFDHPPPTDLKLLYRALDAASCAIVVADALDPAFPLIYVNAAFEQITGYSPKETLGRNCRFLQGTDKMQEGLVRLRKALAKHQGCEVILKNYRKDGTLFWNELRISPVTDARGRLTHYIGIQTDITERVRAQKELEDYRRGLEVKVRERTAQLEEKNLALKELLGQIESEKRQIKEHVASNVDRLILPLLKKIRGAGTASSAAPALAALEKNLQDMTSSFASRLARKALCLTPREIEICNLILGGLSTKDIALFLHVSPDTVENQRNSIRKKLGISRQGENLAVYLQAMAGGEM
ncbi:MAG: PAS domain-containing protein [Candidatus Omnitrophica bacterium]|nr:PAS domain-containing protein [Candidatus Omnitrophota bacterium]